MTADHWRIEEAIDAFTAGKPYDVKYGISMLRLLDRPTAYSREASRLAWGGYLREAVAACRCI